MKIEKNGITYDYKELNYDNKLLVKVEFEHMGKNKQVVVSMAEVIASGGKEDFLNKIASSL